MPVVGAFVFPHGAITLDPHDRDFSNVPAHRPESQAECIKLHEAMERSATALVDLRPDLIIFSTPHGLRLQDSVIFMGNRTVSGTAEWDGDWKDFTAQFTIDTNVSAELKKGLKELENSVDILNIGDPALDPLALRWGEVIPWWFIKKAADSAAFNLPSVILISQRHWPSEDRQSLIPSLLKLGSDLSDMTRTHSSLEGKRIVVVISCDLSHFHSCDPTSPFPCTPLSAKFDQYCVDWAKLNRNPDTQQSSTHALITNAGGLINQIGSCGFTGLVMLHSLLLTEVLAGATFEAKVEEYFAPTYYGMMSSHFIRNDN